MLKIFPKHFFFFIFYLPLFLSILACDSAKPAKETTTIPENPPAITIKKYNQCQDCHPFTLDKNHNFTCQTCHDGHNGTNSMESAHLNLISSPASPDNMAKKCGNCHKSIIDHIASSNHYTLTHEINLVRKAFGANETLIAPSFIPQNDSPKSPLALTDDLLSRRCLRCHIYSSGDTYPKSQHGIGCAACHLKFNNGALLSHKFIRLPDDQICLSCHHGNFVGADYYGLFEHDYNWEYQTPFRLDDTEGPGWGVNYHQLRPDIHQTAGLSCIDCHSGNDLMGDNSRKKASCKTCHAINGKTSVPTMTTKIDQIKLTIPTIDISTHGRKNTACQVCHAQWSFNDSGTHLMRIDEGEYDQWSALTKQGSSDVEQILEQNIFSDDDETDPSMKDQFSGVEKQGLWLKGFALRRWEYIPTCLDKNKILQVCRPILDLYLSYLNEDGEVIIDAVQSNAPDSGMLPYAPHTIGRAGSFISIDRPAP